MTKNSGGTMATANLADARTLGLPVVTVQRPPRPAGRPRSSRCRRGPRLGRRADTVKVIVASDKFKGSLSPASLTTTGIRPAQPLSLLERLGADIAWDWLIDVG
jgi:hypothetical protein